MTAPKKSNETLKGGKATAAKSAKPVKAASKDAEKPAKKAVKKADKGQQEVADNPVPVKAAGRSVAKVAAKVSPPSQEEEAAAKLREQLLEDAEWQQFLAVQKVHLFDLRDSILDMMGTIQQDALGNHPEGSEASGSGEHTGDAGSDAFDRELALGFLAKEQDSLYEIDQALERMKRGYYGICEMSGKLIPKPRLEALPFARLTVECQAQWEKEYGSKTKFRARGGFGYSGGVMETENAAVSLDEDEE